MPVLVKLPASVWARVDDYRFLHRLASRTAAVRALLERGLK